MKLAGLDLAARSGWAFGERTGCPFFGVWTLPGFSDEQRPKSLAGIYSATFAMVKANKIEGVAIEAPLMLDKKSAHTERSLTMLAGAAQAGAHNGGARHIWLVAPSTWRKQVLGHGYPKNPKQASIDYCRLVLKADIRDHNASDAACVLIWAHGQAKLL